MRSSFAMLGSSFMIIEIRVSFIEIQMKKQLPHDEITKMLERENVITFKKKPEQKISLKSQKEQESEEDAPSLKSGVFSEENSLNKPARRQFPLPELNREKKKIFVKNIIQQVKVSGYLEKEVRQQDNLVLKQLNNQLTAENIKLKTKNIHLEKELIRFQKYSEDDPQKSKPIIFSSKDIKSRSSDSINLKMAMRNLQRELEEVRKQNSKIKVSVKFTTISELQVERDAILQETGRLRLLLDEERMKVAYAKATQQGLSTVEQKLFHFQQRVTFLQKQNHQLKNKIQKGADLPRPTFKSTTNQQNLTSMLFTVKRTLKEKEKELEFVRAELKKSKTESLKIIDNSIVPSKDGQVKNQISQKAKQSLQNIKINKDKRIMSKSAQKYRTVSESRGIDNCQSCKKLKQQVRTILKQLEQTTGLLKLEREKNGSILVDELLKEPVAKPKSQEIQNLRRFLIYRFKAHHLTLEEACGHLINCDEKSGEMNSEISVGQLVEVLMAEPFSILSNRYIQVGIVILAFSNASNEKQEKIAIKNDDKVTRKELVATFKRFLGKFELLSQDKEEEMFIQIAELVTTYQQHILKALNEKRNGEGTTTQKDFTAFFREIQLETDYVQFIISQIILESLDLDHLNYFNLFEIFYMPPQQILMEESSKKQHKKKYNMIESVVKEEDEEYEESKSFLESKQKTISRPDECKFDGIIDQEDADNVEKKQQSQNFGGQEEYEEHFEEEKMENVNEEEKAEEQQKEVQHEHYVMEEAEQEYLDDYDPN